MQVVTGHPLKLVRACCTRFSLLGSLVSISKSHLLHAVVQHIQSFDAVTGEGEEVGQPPQLPLPPLDLLHACMIPNRDTYAFRALWTGSYIAVHHLLHSFGR